TGRPITWGLFSRREEPDLWRTYLALLDETAARGGRMFAQVHSRALTIVLSFKTTLPFDRLPVWRELRVLPLEQQTLRLHAPELMKHPRTVVTFSDSGAHVSQIMDASLQTHLLSYWVRAKQALALEQAVRMLSFEPATHWGFTDRGLVREGMAADLLVFDPETITPEMPEVVRDLPAGARRLTQRARGIAATVVNGEIVLRDGKPTGALPGQLL